MVLSFIGFSGHPELGSPFLPVHYEASWSTEDPLLTLPNRALSQKSSSDAVSRGTSQPAGKAGGVGHAELLAEVGLQAAATVDRKSPLSCTPDSSNKDCSKTQWPERRARGAHTTPWPIQLPVGSQGWPKHFCVPQPVPKPSMGPRDSRKLGLV